MSNSSSLHDKLYIFFAYQMHLVRDGCFKKVGDYLKPRIERFWYFAKVPVLFFLVGQLTILVGIRFQTSLNPHFPITVEEPKEISAPVVREEPKPQFMDSHPDVVLQDEEVEALSRLIYSEAGQVPDIERAAVAWCALNRVDSRDFPNTIKGVCEQENQFAGYSEETPITPHNRRIASHVLIQYYLEKRGETAERVLPKEYLYFRGNGEHNYFTKDFGGWEAWFFDCPNPYD